MIVAAIPIKRLSEAKSRLARQLSQAQRAHLVFALGRRTVGVVRSSGLVARIAVVTPEEDLARDLAAEALPDGTDLNESLRNAARWSIEVGASGLVILPGDLPLLQPADLHALLGHHVPGIAVARTGDGGTGALFLRPPDCIEPGFGPGSFERHVDRARRAGLPVRLVQREGLTMDIDTPEDLERAKRLGLDSTLEGWSHHVTLPG